MSKVTQEISDISRAVAAMFSGIRGYLSTASENSLLGFHVLSPAFLDVRFFPLLLITK
jgi:hypothetical protein